MEQHQQAARPIHAPGADEVFTEIVEPRQEQDEAEGDLRPERREHDSEGDEMLVGEKAGAVAPK